MLRLRQKHIPYRTRFRAAYALLALIAAGTTFATGFLYTGLAGAQVRCEGPAASPDPVDTAIRFIQSAVERRNTASSYGLVTPAFREGMSCPEWASGAIPVEPFLNVDWNRATYKLQAQGTGQMVLGVTLTSRTRRPTDFLVELRELDGLWLVGFWTSAERP